MKHTHIIPALSTAALLACCLTGCGSAKIDLNKYADVSYSGSDGHGSAYVSVDYDKLVEDYGDKFKLSGKYESLGSAEDVAELALEMNIECSLDYGDAEQGSLSNGDKVTLDWSVADQLSDALNAKFTYENESYTVSDLQEVETIDAFNGLSVTFDGPAPNGTATLDATDAPMTDSDYTLDVSSGLSNGDIVTVTISESSADSLAEYSAQYPAEMTREYTVEGLASYVSKLEEIPEDVMAKMEKESMDSMMANAADWDEGVTVKSRTHIGNYFLMAKDASTYGNQNEVYLVYEVQAEQNGTAFTYYTYRGFKDLMLMTDGTCSLDYSDYDYPSYGWFNDEGFDFTDGTGVELSYAGYENLDTMFNKLVTAQIDEYTYENTVSLN